MRLSAKKVSRKTNVRTARRKVGRKSSHKKTSTRNTKTRKSKKKSGVRRKRVVKKKSRVMKGGGGDEYGQNEDYPTADKLSRRISETISNLRRKLAGQ